MQFTRPLFMERAYQLARTGKFARVTDIKRAMRQEQYSNVESQLNGAGVRKELKRMMVAARQNTRSDLSRSDVASHLEADRP